MHTAIGPAKPGTDPEVAAARSQALAEIDEVHDCAVRVLTTFEQRDPSQRPDVVWLAADEFRGNVRRTVRVAPLSVGGLLRSRLFGESTVVLTSATLTVGGSFDGLAVNWGLPPQSPARSDTTSASGAEPPSDKGDLAWNGIDVGSPFDHAKAGILYIAKHLTPPGRDGLPPSHLDEIAELVTAAEGRTLGLFSSMRAAKAATEALRERLDTPILCQGDDATGALVEKFAADEATSLFGTLSLWQGVDVPGPSLSLVIIDRIPFPRPDDPLLVARQRAVEARGGNGFMAVAANHAACCWRRVSGVCCAAPTTGVWWRCSTRVWRPRGTAVICVRRCRRSGRRPIRRWSAGHSRVCAAEYPAGPVSYGSATIPSSAGEASRPCLGSTRTV